MNMLLSSYRMGLNFLSIKQDSTAEVCQKLDTCGKKEAIARYSVLLEIIRCPDMDTILYLPARKTVIWMTSLDCSPILKVLESPLR